MLFLIISLTAFIFVWAISFKNIISIRGAIVLSSVANWRKCVKISSMCVPQWFWNTSPSFCLPETIIWAQVKIEGSSEMLEIHCQITSWRTRKNTGLNHLFMSVSFVSFMRRWWKPVVIFNYLSVSKMISTISFVCFKVQNLDSTLLSTRHNSVKL